MTTQEINGGHGTYWKNEVKTVRQFDEIYTAPHRGFNDAADYYYRASSLRVVDNITIPTLILSAVDDPFVPHEQFSEQAISNNSHITTLITEYGGHCGFYTSPETGFDGYWAEQTALQFILEQIRASWLNTQYSPRPTRTTENIKTRESVLQTFRGSTSESLDTISQDRNLWLAS